ncbi:hypothetical protein TPE_2378 [Treponema pedis str. T A4]|uniref:Uncharacterized protein n=1 Tax=Treponema pedis str. T A4 TaxID=1291379 RepID=S5ZQC2_9SPIR|nr:hypothetical protein TPE_2378 [Treponema pedis str. T A4]
MPCAYNKLYSVKGQDENNGEMLRMFNTVFHNVVQKIRVFA